MTILIIGLGSIAEKHIIAIRSLIVDPNICALRTKGHTNVLPGVKNIYSIDGLEDRPDFIIISNPTYLHAESIKESAVLGCPLFIEKPVLQDVSEIETVNEILTKHKTVSYVACNLRFHPAIQFLQTYLKDGTQAVNEVNIYCGSYLPDWRPGRDFRTVYSAIRSMGGGVHRDLVHELDYCCWLFGMPKESHSLRRNVSSLHIDADDYAQYNLLYDAFSVNIALNYYRRDARRDIEIVTESDTIKADLLHCNVVSLKNGILFFHEGFSMQDTYIAQMKYFIEQMKSNQKPMNGFPEAAAILKIALA
jgi:predicted dehydrogenase